jgi:hypothetical protein
MLNQLPNQLPSQRFHSTNQLILAPDRPLSLCRDDQA